MNNARDPEGLGEGSKVIPFQKDELSELKRLLLAAEQAQLEELLRRLNDPRIRAKEISGILPEALLDRAGKDRKLIPALMTTVEEIIRVSVQKNPWTLIDSLFPVMGPAIRKSISESLKGMIQSLNEALEHSLSFRGLRWRIESWRTGKPFAEVVLLHCLVFRVEQVFLIHKNTGLLLSHVTAESAIVQDADMVSGMLTAIGDFVRDSFETGQGDSLDNLQMGEVTVLIEHGPLAYLAAVVRGTPSTELRSILKETLETIHLEFSDALAAFDGNAAPFGAASARLEDCLQNRYDTGQRKTFPYFRLASVLLCAVVGYWVFTVLQAGWRWQGYVERLRAEKGIVVVSSEKRHGKHLIFGLRDPLAKDPSALLEQNGLDPRDVIGHWDPYQAMEPEFILVRAREALAPPDTVSLTLADGILTATGVAPFQWAADARKLARSIAGVKQYRDKDLSVDLDAVLAMIRTQLNTPNTVDLRIKDGVLIAKGVAPYQWVMDSRRLAGLLAGIQGYRDNGLIFDYKSVLERIKRVLDPPATVGLEIADGVLYATGAAPHDWIIKARETSRTFAEIVSYQDEGLSDLDMQKFNRLAAAIEKKSIRFESGTVRLALGNEKELADVASMVLALDAVARRLDIRYRIVVKGHTDSSGSAMENIGLSRKRAEDIASHLTSRGISSARIFFEGAGATNPAVTEGSEKDKALNRRVTLEVVTEDQPLERGHR